MGNAAKAGARAMEPRVVALVSCMLGAGLNCRTTCFKLGKV